MNRVKERYEIDFRGFGRHTTDPVGEISAADMMIWRQACSVLKNVRYDNPDAIELTVDWSEAAAFSEETYRISKLTPKELIEYYRNLNRSRATPKIKFDIDTTNHGPIYVEYLIHQAFLALNLSCPGSFECYRAFGSVEKGLDIEINLSATLYDVALMDSGRAGIIVRKDLSLAKTWNWLCEVTTPSQQIARTRIERVLYGLLNLAREDAYNPDCLMWLTHIMEGLYDTSIGASYNSLKRRAQDVLSIPERKKKEFSKELRHFYDVRSAFVHGALDIEHPLGIDSWDKTCNTYRGVLAEAIGFAMTVAISTIQVLIENNWSSLSFNETLVGNKI